MLLSCLAIVPILWLIIALTVLKMPGHKACISALVVGAIMALTLWHMPATDCLTSAIEGFAVALWPIILVIIAAIFTYNLSLKTGAMEIIKQMLTSVSADKRILILLVGWCFGGFLEGMAGFGTAIAIPASMLAGMGMNPIEACIVCMIANMFPTAFGSVGIPTVTLQAITGLHMLPLAFTTVFQMVPFMILSPFLMVIAGGGGPKALKGVVGITLVSGVSFVVPELIVSYFLGPELTVIVGSVVSLVCTFLMAKARKNKPIPAEYDMNNIVSGAIAKNEPEQSNVSGTIANTESEQSNASGAIANTESGQSKPAAMKLSVALMPFILIFVFLLLTSKLVPPINSFLSSFKSTLQISSAHGAGKISFAWINTPGVLIFIAAILGSIVQKANGKMMREAFTGTMKQMSKTIITIMAVLAVAKIMTYSGMISDMAHLFVTLTGHYYPFVAPIIAAIGAFVTGSGTNTEVLLGTLQTAAAQQIHISQYWLAAANSLGAGIGKVISPQCIATAVAAVSLVGQDSKVLRAMMKWALITLVIACLVIGFGVSLTPA
ncbi:MAG TPA: lactate permease [Clostridiales bacterium]|jgi:lactate permease|nr:lactate permease [Clostridiales bacterium]